MNQKDVEYYLSIVYNLQKACGVSLYLVGGFLRDYFLGYDGYDMDFAVKGDSKEIALLFGKKIGGTFVVLDENEKTYRIVKKKDDYFCTFDFSALRGDSIEEDVKIRDFTMNALAAPLPTGMPFDNVIDVVQGREDIRNRIIRMNNAQVFSEDPLRLIRAYRIAAQYNCTIDQRTKNTMREYASFVPCVSFERIHDELIKFFSRNVFSLVLEMNTSGVLESICPEINRLKNETVHYFHPDGLWGHSLEVLFCFEHIVSKMRDFFSEEECQYFEKAQKPHNMACMKIVCLLHDIGKPEALSVDADRVRFLYHELASARYVTAFAKRLRFSTKDVGFIRRCVLYHMDGGNLAKLNEISDRACYRFFKRTGTCAPWVILFTLADSLATVRGKKGFTYRDGFKDSDFADDNFVHYCAALKRIVKWQIDAEKYLPKQNLITGKDVMSICNIPAGKLVGVILETVHEAIGAGIIRSVKAAKKHAKKWFLKNTFYIINRRTGKAVAKKTYSARTFWTRFKGLLGKTSLNQREGMLLFNTKQIHSLGMLFSIDVIFLDKDGRILCLYKNFKPFRVSKYCKNAFYCLELSVGTIDLKDVKIGDILVFEPKRNGD